METAQIVSRRRVLMGAGAGGLGLLAATALAPGVAAAHTNEDESSADDQLTGSWLVTVTIDGTNAPPPFKAVIGFASGNVLTTNDSNGGPAGVGSWKKTGDDGFAATFYSADTDQNGKPTGGFDKIRAAGTHDGNHISGKFKLDGFDGKGNPTFSATGKIDGHRIVVEPL